MPVPAAMSRKGTGLPALTIKSRMRKPISIDWMPLRPVGDFLVPGSGTILVADAPPLLSLLALLSRRAIRSPCCRSDASVRSDGNNGIANLADASDTCLDHV